MRVTTSRGFSVLIVFSIALACKVPLQHSLKGPVEIKPIEIKAPDVKESAALIRDAADKIDPLALKSFLEKLAAALEENSQLKLKAMNDELRQQLDAVEKGKLANSYRICWLSSSNDPCTANINVWIEKDAKKQSLISYSGTKRTENCMVILGSEHGPGMHLLSGAVSFRCVGKREDNRVTTSVALEKNVNDEASPSWHRIGEYLSYNGVVDDVQGTEDGKRNASFSVPIFLRGPTPTPAAPSKG